MNSKTDFLFSFIKDGQIYDAIITNQPGEIIQYDQQNVSLLYDNDNAPSDNAEYVSNEMAMMKKILENQSQLLSHVLDLKNGIKNLSSDFEKLKGKLKGKFPVETDPLPQQEPTIPELWKFTKIQNEKDFIDFQNRIEVDQTFKNECIIKMKDGVGSMVGISCYDCALKLDRIIFTNNFWTSTAWTGGRNKAKKRKIDSADQNTDDTDQNADENTDHNANNAQNEQLEESSEESSNNSKFAFSKHQRFMEFFKQLILYVNGQTLTDDDYKKFVQSRARNSFYQPKTARKPVGRIKTQKQ